MTNRIIPIQVTILEIPEVANSVARAELEGIYSGAHSGFKLEQLEKDGITVDSLAEYYTMCAAAQAAFCEAKRDRTSSVLREDYGIGFAELRMLYLPPVMATILSGIGDVTIGSYHIEVCAAKAAKVDRAQMIKMSEALYRNQNILYCQKDQIGVANREASVDMMATVVVTSTECVTTEETEVEGSGQKEVVVPVTSEHHLLTRTFVGVTPDKRCRAINAMAGIVLVNGAYDMLYPFEDFLEYGRPTKIVAVSHSKTDGD